MGVSRPRSWSRFPVLSAFGENQPRFMKNLPKLTFEYPHEGPRVVAMAVPAPSIHRIWHNINIYQLYGLDGFRVSDFGFRVSAFRYGFRASGVSHPGAEQRANLESTPHRCQLFEVAFVWELTKESIHLPLCCLQGGRASVL